MTVSKMWKVLQKINRSAVAMSSADTALPQAMGGKLRSEGHIRGGRAEGPGRSSHGRHGAGNWEGEGRFCCRRWDKSPEKGWVSRLEAGAVPSQTQPLMPQEEWEIGRDCEEGIKGF